MRYLALATDYDGTIAHEGHVDAPTVAALERVRQSGRKLILVTGREMDDLRRTFAPLDLVGVGDAENDHAFLKLCGCSAAVANALPSVKETADLALHGARGEGVAELIALLLADEQALVRGAPRCRS